MSSTIEIFCCYARKDQSFLLELKNHLKPLEHSGLIAVQADVDVSPGEEWEQKISRHLNTAHIILLLVSADFVASKYCYDVEMKRALERHNKGETHVIPIILRPVSFQHTPFGKLQSLPTNARPITTWANSDEAFLDVINGIEKVIRELNDTSIWTEKGKELRELQRCEEALTAYEEALQRDSNDVDAYLGKGRVYLDLGRYNDALKVYEQATNVAPNNTWAWHDKGQALGHLQRVEEALEAFEHAIGLDPENKWAWFHKAETLMYLAQQAYKKAGQPGKEPLKRGYYNLVHKVTGKCLDGDGSRVYMHTPNDGEFQLWKAIEVSPNTIVLKHFQSGKVLGATMEGGTYFREYNDSPSQQWIPEDVGNGYQLKQVAIGMFLHGDTNNNVYLQPKGGGGFEIWRAVRMQITSLIAPYGSSNSAELLVFEQ